MIAGMFLHDNYCFLVGDIKTMNSFNVDELFDRSTRIPCVLFILRAIKRHSVLFVERTHRSEAAWNDANAQIHMYVYVYARAKRKMRARRERNDIHSDRENIVRSSDKSRMYRARLGTSRIRSFEATASSINLDTFDVPYAKNGDFRVIQYCSMYLRIIALLNSITARLILPNSEAIGKLQASRFSHRGETGRISNPSAKEAAAKRTHPFVISRDTLSASPGHRDEICIRNTHERER